MACGHCRRPRKRTIIFSAGDFGLLRRSNSSPYRNYRPNCGGERRTGATLESRHALGNPKGSVRNHFWPPGVPKTKFGNPAKLTPEPKDAQRSLRGSFGGVPGTARGPPEASKTSIFLKETKGFQFLLSCGFGTVPGDLPGRPVWLGGHFLTPSPPAL